MKQPDNPKNMRRRAMGLVLTAAAIKDDAEFAKRVRKIIDDLRAEEETYRIENRSKQDIAEFIKKDAT